MPTVLGFTGLDRRFSISRIHICAWAAKVVPRELLPRTVTCDLCRCSAVLMPSSSMISLARRSRSGFVIFPGPLTGQIFTQRRTRSIFPGTSSQYRQTYQPAFRWTLFRLRGRGGDTGIEVAHAPCPAADVHEQSRRSFADGCSLCGDLCGSFKVRLRFRAAVAYAREGTSRVRRVRSQTRFLNGKRPHA
jgi:hypothetical protein